MNQLLFVAILAAFLYTLNLLLFLALHFSRSGYTVRKHAVSDYAVGKTARLFQVYLWIGNVAALALAHLFYYSVRPDFPTFVALCTLLMVIARIGVGLFKTDLEGQKRTRQGTLHYLFAILNFALAYTVIDNATPILTALSDGRLIYLFLALSRYIALVSLVGVVITMFRPLRRFFGVIERVFLLTTVTWFLAASVVFAMLNGL